MKNKYWYDHKQVLDAEAIEKRMQTEVKDISFNLAKLELEKKELSTKIKTMEAVRDKHLQACVDGFETIPTEVYNEVSRGDRKTYVHRYEDGFCLVVRESTEEELQELPGI